MSYHFTAQFQTWSTLTAVGIFVGVAYVTRATRWQGVKAFVAALLCSALNILLDLLAHKAGWWWYPGQPGAILPMPVYFAQDLVWCGALGLVGWRIYRRFNLFGMVVFVVVVSAAGAIRDSLISVQTKAIVFGAGLTPRVADYACWITLLLIAQACISTKIRASGRSYLK